MAPFLLQGRPAIIRTKKSEKSTVEPHFPCGEFYYSLEETIQEMKCSTDADSTPTWLLNQQQAAAMAESSKKRASDASAEAARHGKSSKRPTSNSRSAAATQEMLAQYPSFPLSEYASDGDHLTINVDFPGLRAIHKDPWIFLVPDLLSCDECEQMMDKAEPHFQPSYGYSNAHRTSSECRLARRETKGIQARYSALLNKPVENMEAAKVSRYRRGEYFKNHVDPLSDTDFLENRIATLFVYLNDCERGGETRFLSLPSVRSLSYVVGEAVCCLSTGRDIDGEGDYPGMIKAVHQDGTLDIDFDDGDKLENVARSAVRAYETLLIKPAQGLGVLFFPAYLPTSPMAMKFHKQLDRHTVHEGCVAVDEKWVHQTWVWPSHPQAHYDGVETGGALL